LLAGPATRQASPTPMTAAIARTAASPTTPDSRPRHAVKPARAKFCYEMMGWLLPDSCDAYLKIIKAVMAPMETQVREHQIQLKRRLESIKRIHQATDTLEDRINELLHVENNLVSQLVSLEKVGKVVQHLLDKTPNQRSKLSAA